MISSKVLVALLIVLIAISGYALYSIKSEGTKCMADPFKYSINILEKGSTDPVICTCRAGSKTVVITNNGSVDLNSYLPQQNISLGDYQMPLF